MNRIACASGVAALTACVWLSSTPVSAQEREFAQAGTIEIAGGISFASITPVSNGQTENATTLFSFAPEVSYYVTDGFEIGFSPGISLLPGVSVITPSSGQGTTLLQLFASPAYTFHRTGNQANPFLQLQLGYTSASSGSITESGFSWGVRGGLKIIATSHMLVTMYAQYHALSFTPKGDSERTGMNVLSFGVAVGGFF